jgi:dTDP-4-dehydrorhamnose 3,5-epimerase
VIEPNVFGDERGFFLEFYNAREFAALGIDRSFVQDNHSRSRRGVLRGLHYQLRRPQAKLLRVVQGEVLDVAVDLRRGSPTLGRWHGEILSAENKRMIFVPEGFAHGFYVLSESADINYKCSDFYASEDERGVAWNDPELAINWPLGSETPTLSARDRQFLPLGRVSPDDLPLFSP